MSVLRDGMIRNRPYERIERDMPGHRQENLCRVQAMRL